tara:strand:- start:549 stop:740 length:192 start_codon:yes stop_codon:yes gene_type:complete
MENADIQFWIEIDDKILDIIDLIRTKYPKFNRTPVEKVIVKLYDAYRASGKVADAIDKGWVPR